MSELLLNDALKRLKLPTIRRMYAEVAREAAEHNQTFEEFLLELVEHELRQREENQLRHRLRQAGFPVMKTLEAFDFSVIPALNKPKVLMLAQCNFVAQHENVLLVGNSGTGKTHLATAFGAAACRKGYKVRFWTAAALVQELLAAQHEHRLAKLEKAWLRTDLVVVDDVGYTPFSSTGAELLFQFVAALYERGSLVVTSNLEFSEWTRVLGDERLTAALLDRLTHRAHILPMNGESHRFRESLRRQQQDTA